MAGDSSYGQPRGAFASYLALSDLTIVVLASATRPELSTQRGLLNAAITAGAVGEYQLQAAIAALHDRALRVEDTDWPQILALYGLLEQMTGNPIVSLNRAIAAAMVHGPAEACACWSSWMPACQAATAWTQYARTSTRWRATRPRRPCTLEPPRPARRAHRSAAT